MAGNLSEHRLLLGAVVLGALVLGGALLFAKYKTMENPPDLSTAIPSVIRQKPTAQTLVTVPDVLRACAAGDKCIVVDTSCSFCCGYVAINAKYEQLFNQMFSDTCGDYKGVTCECFDLDNYPDCVKTACELVKWPDEK